MHKNFAIFLKEKDFKNKSINEGIVSFFKRMVGDVDLQAEEQEFIYNVNTSFKKYANSLIGLQYYNDDAKKTFLLNDEKANSIYRNLKKNFVIILRRSYRKDKTNFNMQVEDPIITDAERKEIESNKLNTTPPVVMPTQNVQQEPSITAKPPAQDATILGGAVELKFMYNLNRLILNIEKYFQDSDEIMPEKIMFNTLSLVKRFYKYSESDNNIKKRFKKHSKNINHLGNENWNFLLTSIINIFISKQCNFGNEGFTNEAINTFKEKASKFRPIDVNYTSFDGSLRRDKNWNNIKKSLVEIDNLVQQFCTNNPNLCTEKGRGSIKLLLKLKENKNISFSDWLLIAENKLF